MTVEYLSAPTDHFPCGTTEKNVEKNSRMTDLAFDCHTQNTNTCNSEMACPATFTLPCF